MFRNISILETPRVVHRLEGCILRPVDKGPSCRRMQVMNYQGKSIELVYRWFRLFSDILDDEYLIIKLCTSLKTLAGLEEEDVPISTNLPERWSHRVKRIRIGKNST